MKASDIERLLAMLKPQCDRETFNFVRDTLAKGSSKKRDSGRSDQQKVDVYDTGLSNDPVNW